VTFLEAVNRILRIEGIIQGDDDDQTSFSQTQHAASMSLAQIAVQSQIADLVAGDILPYERTSGTLTTTALTRTYTLASDFQTLEEMFFEELEDDNEASGTRVVHYKGGESQLRADFPRYQEDTGTPIYFYFTGGSSKTIGFSPVPDSAKSYRYYYQKDVNVSNASDQLPFVTVTECQTFVRMCARMFKYLRATPQVREGLFPAGVERDPVILESRATLSALLNPLPDKQHYGKRYGRA